jgi:general secretion pathway protein H
MPPRSPRSRGFTLLELLVVIVIAGIVLSLVAVNAMPNDRSRVLDEGARTARLFELAQEEAQLRARPLAWEADNQGWRFTESTPRGWVPLVTDVLAPGRWHAPMDAVQILDGPGVGLPPRLVFGREAIDQPFRLTLQRAGFRVDVTGDGSGRYQSEAPQ